MTVHDLKRFTANPSDGPITMLIGHQGDYYECGDARFVDGSFVLEAGSGITVEDVRSALGCDETKNHLPVTVIPATRVGRLAVKFSRHLFEGVASSVGYVAEAI